MKKIILSALTIVFLATSCSKDEEFVPSINASDFTKTVDENLAASTEIGTLTATGNDGAITYSLVSQTPSGAIAVSNDGKITVADATKFDFETNPKIEATVKAKSANTSKDIKVTINLNDVDDLLAFLSTSKTKYKNAATNDWVEITKAEYDNLATKLNQTTKVGLSDSEYEEDITKINFGGTNFTASFSGPKTKKMPKNGYIVAFKYSPKYTNDITNVRLKVSASTNPRTGFQNVGNALPTHKGGKVMYFIIKNNSLKNAAEGYTALYVANSQAGWKNYNGYSIVFQQGDSDILIRDATTDLNLYQAIATTQKQW